MGKESSEHVDKSNMCLLRELKMPQDDLAVDWQHLNISIPLMV